MININLVNNKQAQITTDIGTPKMVECLPSDMKHD